MGSSIAWRGISWLCVCLMKRLILSSVSFLSLVACNNSRALRAWLRQTLVKAGDALRLHVAGLAGAPAPAQIIQAP